MARPARVRIRSRKPWTFARRRLFGWNVRLLTGAPGAVLIYQGIEGSRRRVPRSQFTGGAASEVSLLTVKAIPVQVKPSPPARQRQVVISRLSLPGSTICGTTAV